MGRSRGGLTGKIHAVVDTNGLPVRLGLTAGEAHDNRLALKLLSRLRSGSMLLADRGNDADWIRAFATQMGAWANVPPRSNRREPISFSPHLYRARNLVERFFNKIKQCRRVATRYDKLAANNLTFISITAADLLNSVCATHSHCVSFVISAQTLGTSQLGCRRSIQSRMRVRADLSGGTSSASSKRPRGNIQRPKMGRKPSNPPQIRSIAAARRIHADAGRLNHRTAAFSRGGSRAIS